MINWLKKNSSFLRLTVVLFLLLGLYSIFSITREVTPSINIPNYIISVPVLGGDPETIDQQVIQKLETRFRGMSLVNKVTTTSSFGFGIINVEFSDQKTNLDATNDIKNIIDQVYPTLPAGTQYPVVRKVDIADSPIYTFAVGGNLDNKTLYSYTKELENEIKGIPGVSELIVIGKPLEQIQILFDYEKLQKYNVDFNVVVNTLRSLHIKGGTDRKDIGGRLYTIELANYDTIDEIIDIVNNASIGQRNARGLKIKDVADVYINFQSNEKASYVIEQFITSNILSTISFQVKKIPGADIQKVTIAIKEKISAFEKKFSELRVYETMSMQEASDKIFNSFIGNFFQTGLQVFIIILLFMGFRSAFVSLIGFVLVYAITLIILFMSGETFNNITSFSLILVLGIMVDNIVIIVEGTIEKLRSGEKDVREAIGYSLKSYAMPIVIGTLSQVLVFVPILFSLTGIIGQFMRSFPITVNLNLLVSLFVTIIIVPVIIVRFLPKNYSGQEDNVVKSYSVWGVQLYQKIYQLSAKKMLRIHLPARKFYGIPFVPPSIAIGWIEKAGQWFGEIFIHLSSSKFQRWATLTFFWLLFVCGIALIPLGVIKTDFIGNSDSNNVWINTKFDSSITFEENKKLTYEISQQIVHFLKEELYGIESISLDIGSTRGQNSIENAFSAGGGNANTMSYTIRLYETSESTPSGRYRAFKSFELVEKLQQFLDNEIKSSFPQVKEISALTQKGGPGSGKPVAINIKGYDLNVMGNYISTILPEIKKIPEIYNITTNIDYTNGKIQYHIDEEMIKERGLSLANITTLLSSIKNSVYRPNGVKIREFITFGDDPLELKAFVIYSGDINNIQINNVYLSQLTKDVHLEPELKTITRVDGKRSMIIDADKISSVPLGAITPKIDEIIKNNPLPEGLEFSFGADVQTQADSAKQLLIAFALGMMLMFMILVYQFGNIKYPIIILTSTFLSVSGGLFALMLFGYDFNFPAQLGMFGVIGVGVNQAIVIIDYIEELIQHQSIKNMQMALRQAIEKRFIPIFITNSTGILGVVSVVFSDQVFGSLGITFLGGLFLSVFLGLRYVPVLLLMLDKRDPIAETDK